MSSGATTTSVTMIDSRCAHRVVATAVDLAEADGGSAVAAAVADPHGHVVAFLRGDGCPLRATRLAAMKAYTAARFATSTAALGERLAASGRPLGEYGDRRFTALAGGVPIGGPSGHVVGAVGVSGRAPDDDDRLARAALETLRLVPLTTPEEGVADGAVARASGQAPAR